MNVERIGNGPRAFVGVHGWAGNSRTFRRLYDYMPADASFFAMDLPGYGDSVAPAELTLEPVLECIANAIRQAPSGGSAGWWHSTGMLIPAAAAAW